MRRKCLFAAGIVLVALAVWGGIYILWPLNQTIGPPAGPDGQPTTSTTPGTTHPAKWAQSVPLPGCPNLYKVSDDLYRGAQPNAEGMKALKDLGIRTIVNLRSFHSDRDEMGDLGFNYEHIHMKAWHPEDEEVVRFLRIMSDESKHPVFLHCQHGADRTGTMCAIYRIALQGWSKEEALEEMVRGGFGFHGVWQVLLRYTDGLNIEEMKRRAAVPD